MAGQKALSAMQVVRLFPAITPGGGLLCVLRVVRMFYLQETPRRMSIMDTLNFVVNLLNLLVNLFTGLAPFVWMVAKDVFQTTKLDAKHFSDKK